MKQTISTCTACKKSFNNPALVPWCPKCDEEMNGCPAPLNKSKSEIESAQPSPESNTETPSGEFSILKSSGLDDLKTWNPKEKNLERDITPTWKKRISVAPITLEKIESDKESTTENSMRTIKNDFEESSTLPAIAETRLEDSTQPFVDLNKEISHSMSLLNQSENELFASMKGLRSNQPDTAVRLYDPERVQTAVLCGRQIVESMKTKIELMKFAKEVRGSK